MSGTSSSRVRVAIVVALMVLTGLFPGVVAGASPANPAFRDVGTSSTGSWIVTLKAGRDPVRRASTLARSAGGRATKVYSHALHGFAFTGSAREAAALRRDPAVRTVVPNRTVHLLDDGIPTGIGRIRADHPSQPNAHSAGFTGAGVRVAILDTGIDLTHPDLVPNLDIALGRNCMTPGLPPQDGHGHGTHVAGIIAAADNGLGVIGVAPDARLVPFKVLNDQGSGEWSNLICAIDYITGLATDGDPSNDIKVANMSLGDVGGLGTCTDGGVREAICRSTAAGVTYVAAAGNSTVDTSTFIPAAFPEVIAVSALTDLDGEPGGHAGCWLIFLFCDDTLAEYSNFGASVDLTAPGTQIYSDWTGGGYASEMGTSMAAPHVTGVAALILAAHPTFKPADVEELLKTTGECPNGAFADDDGSGDCVGKGQWGNDPDGIAEPLVNALHAVEGGSPGDHRPVVHITSPADGASINGLVTVIANATDDVGVTQVAFFRNGTLVASDTDGSNGWSMVWDTAATAAGVYSLTAMATDTIGQIGSKTITVSAGTSVKGGWLGHFGLDGDVLANWTGSADEVDLPPGVTFTAEQASRYSWVAPTTDVRALQSRDGTERRARTWYDDNQIRLRLTFANGYTGNIHLYAVDWDSYGPRGEDITVDDGQGPRTVKLATGSFVNGAWVHVPITVPAGGSVVIKVDRTASNAVLSGLFLGDGGTPPPPPPPPPPPATVDLPGVKGGWLGHFGLDGDVLANWTGSADEVDLPPGVTFTAEQASRYSWVAPTTDVRALQSRDGTERRARTWYDDNQIRLRLTFANGYTGNIHLYAVDWDSYGPRGEDITVDDGQGPRTVKLATGSFVNGAWVHVPITVPAGGSVVIKVDRTASNAVLSGLFLGDGGTPPPPPPPPPPPATVDLPGVKGGWLGHFGLDGDVLANWTGSADEVDLPPGVTFTAEQASRYSWVAPTTDVRALQSRDGTERRARTWYDDNQIRLRLTFANGYTGNIHLYAVDWDSYGPRGEDITVDDGQGPRTVKLATGSFVNGAWVHVPITVPAGGSVVIKVDRTASNAVLSGLFLGDGGTPPPPPPPTAPGAPTGLSATPGNGQVTLSWSAPASDGGSQITGYTATASPGGATCSTTGARTCPVTGLANGTLYTFTVKATNAVGTGPASASASATPVAPPTAPGAPTGLSATPGNGQVTLSWSAPASDGGSQITGYTATASPGGATCSTTGARTCPVTGLANGTLYTFTVKATNAVGTGPASASASATPVAPPTAPGAPTGLSATPGNGQVTLSWSAPASDGGSQITGYQVYRATTGGAEALVATLGVVTTFSDTGRTNGTTYFYQVAALNAAGEGPRSTEASVKPATVATAPRSVVAAQNATKGVTLTWVAPSSTGGSAITGYRVYRGTTTGSQTFLIAIGNVTTYVDAATTAGVRYYYRLSAVNGVGEGPLSARVTAIAR